MGIFSKEEANEAYEKAFELVKGYTPEEFEKWKKAITKAYKAHQEFKELDEPEEAPADEIEKIEQEIQEYIETENK